MKISHESYGTRIETNEFLAVFGNKNFSIEFFPNIHFRKVTQVHGTDLVCSDKDIEQTADAHYTDKKTVALLISTADCMPLLFWSPSRNRITAVHAGWRGIAGKIIKNALAINDLNDLQIFIGPHILKNSFEVDLDVKDQILSSLKNPLGPYTESKGAKYFVDLHQIAIEQLKEAGIQLEQIHSFLKDTKTGDQLHSYRRDGPKSGRNLSFITIK